MVQDYSLTVALALSLLSSLMPSSATPTPHHPDLVRRIVDDPLTGIIATMAFTVVAVAIGAYLTLRARDRRTITYRIIASKLFSVDDEQALGGRMKIEFDGEQRLIRDLDIDVIIIRFVNSGNRDIRENSTDAIRVSFEARPRPTIEEPFWTVPDIVKEHLESVEVLSTDIIEPSRIDMDRFGMKASTMRNPANGGEALIGTLLLRKGRSITVRALVKDNSGIVEIVNQIPDVEMRNANQTRTSLDTNMAGAAVGTLFGVGPGYLVLAAFHLQPLLIALTLSFISLLSFVVVMNVYSVLYGVNRPRET